MFRLNDFIKYLKDQKIEGASQEAIGKILGKPQAYISQICNGNRPFANEYIDMLSEKFGTDAVMQFYDPDSNMANAINGSTAVAGNGNHVNSETDKFLEIIREQGSMMKKSQEQIDRLISIIENHK